MDASSVPNLEELNEQQAARFLTEMLTNLSAEAEYEIRHDDFVMEMPQSGERVRGRERMRELQAAFGGDAPGMRLRRLSVRKGLWMAEIVSD